MKQRLAMLAATALILGAGIYGLTLAQPAEPPAAGTPDVCDALDSGKIDTTGDPLTVTLTAPAGFLITHICIKAGSTQSGAGTEVFDVIPPVPFLTIGHTSGKAVSHFSFSYIRDTTTTSTSTSTTSTTSTTTTEPHTDTTSTTSTTSTSTTSSTSPRNETTTTKPTLVEAK